MSKSIAFIGVGNMGCPMAENLMKAGKAVKVFDVSEKMMEVAKDKNLETVTNLNDLITQIFAAKKSLHFMEDVL